MAVAAEDRSGDLRLAADPAVRPDDRVVDNRGLFDVRVPADDPVGSAAAVPFDDRALVDETGPVQLGPSSTRGAVGDQSFFALPENGGAE